MAALPYLQLYPADYLADTQHFHNGEHGAYLLLIFNYWQTGKPLPDDDRKLAAIAKVDPAQWAAVRATLEEFFVVADGVWTHKRLERDLEAVRAQSQANAAAANKRWAKHKQTDSKAPAVRPQSDRIAPAVQPQCHKDPDKETDKDKPITPLPPTDVVGVCVSVEGFEFSDLGEKAATYAESQADPYRKQGFTVDFHWVKGWMSTFTPRGGSHKDVSGHLLEIWRETLDAGLAQRKFPPSWYQKVFASKVLEWSPPVKGTGPPRLAAAAQPWKTANVVHLGKSEGVVNDAF